MGFFVLGSNIIIDAFLLRLTAMILKRRPALWRLGISALFGAFYALLGFYYSGLAQTVFLLPLCVAMILLCFGYCGLWAFLKSSAIFLLTTALYGGLFSMVSGYQGNYILTVAAPVLALPGFFLCGRLAARMRREELKLRATRVLRVEHNGQACELRAYQDTGNFLTEPQSGLPVFLAEEERIRDLLPALLRNGQDDGTRIAILPYRTVSGGTQSILAFRPERAAVDGESCDCYVGIYRGKLSPRGDFQALINQMG